MRPLKKPCGKLQGDCAIFHAKSNYSSQRYSLFSIFVGVCFMPGWIPYLSDLTDPSYPVHASPHQYHHLWRLNGSFWFGCLQKGLATYWKRPSGTENYFAYF